MARFAGFRAAYLRKKSSGSPSALAPLIALLDGFPAEPTKAAIAPIRAELRRVSGITRWFSQNPAMKYLGALNSLTDELDAMELDLRLGAIDRAAEARLSAAAHNARNVTYTEVLKASKTDKEYCAPITAAMVAVCAEPKFAKYLFEEIGWTNVTSWINWGLRAATPAMAAGWAAKDATAKVREMALRASVSGHVYLERYFLELSIYCAAAADKADVGVVFEQASMVFGPLLGPVMLAVGGGDVAQYALKGGKKLAEIGIKAGADAATTDAFGTSKVAITYEGKPVTKDAVNFMRFTHAWLKYAISETPSANMQVVMTEFGGKRGCGRLLETVLEM